MPFFVRTRSMLQTLALIASAFASLAGQARAAISCDSAAKALGNGAPRMKDRDAYSMIVTCPNGAEALAAIWARLPLDRGNLAALADASARLLDRRILDAATGALARTSLSRATRGAAIRVILAQYAPDLVADENVWSDPEHAILARRAPLHQRLGEDTLDAVDRRHVAQIFAALEKTEPDQLIRRVAKRIATDLGATRLEIPPQYPWDGFGRIGCYAGPGLDRMGTTGADLPDAAAAARGPWLIIDSVGRSELRAAGWKDSDIGPRDAYTGILLERRDTLAVTFGGWRRVSPDSIVFDEGSAFPGVSWHFRVTPTALVGEGVLVHDVVLRGADGKDQIPVSRWPAHLRRIDCARVPRVHAWWVPR